MSSEEDKAIPRRSTRVIGYALFLSVGLYFLVLGGGAIYLLAPLLLPPTIVQNDNSPFFIIGIQALGFVFLGGLMIPGGLIGLKAVHWLVAIGMVLLSLLAAFGPGLLFPPGDIPVSPITIFSGVMVLLCLILLSRLKRVWPVLWRTLLVAGVGTVIAIVVLFWPSPPGVYASQYLNPAMVALILIVGYWFASRARALELES